MHENVWQFRIGGYQVCHKWLKDRKGLVLTKEDVTHYQRIVVALSETIRVMARIDQVIEQHGGWPAAFSIEPGRRICAANADLLRDPDAAEVKQPLVRRKSISPAPDLFSYPSSAASELEPARRVASGTDATDRDELCAEIRILFSEGGARDRETAITQLARAFGYKRTSSDARETMDNAIRAALRRGILENTVHGLKLRYRNVEQHEAEDRAALKDQLLASLDGNTWAERDEATTNFARWLGFRRTGPKLEAIAASLINGLLREGRLERDGTRIRRTRSTQ